MFSTVIGGYVAAGGHIDVLWQPYEFIIIFGAAIGAFLIGNSKSVIGKVGGALGLAFKGPSFTKPAYLELLTMLYSVFKLAKTKGMLALEQHIENPHESSLFKNFPKFIHDHHAVEFLSDYLRMITMGSEDPNQMEDLMNAELDIHHEENHALSGALQNMADSMPALGIVAAVLGVIHTMGSINQPPEVLGHLIGAALVGTFFGILMCYGLIGPIASQVKNIHDSDGKYLMCIKSGILAHMRGYAPAVSVEYARKALQSTDRPSFIEVEQAVGNLPPVG